MTKLVLILAMVSTTGCSIFLTRGPSDSAPATPKTASAPDCTTSMTWPTVDGVVAGLITVALIAGISSKNQADRPDSDAVTGGFIIAGTAGVGALIGHGRVSRCRRSTETFTAQYYGGQQQPAYPQAQQGYYPPAPYPQQPQPYQQQYPQQQYPQGYTYPQQYPAQQYPAQQYPAPQQPAPQQPVATKPPPSTKPAIPPVPLNPTIPKPKPAAPKLPPPPPKSDPILGTEGDVCTAPADCGAGLACTGNVCVKK